MIPQPQLTKLRNREPITVFDSEHKLFVKIQLNKEENFICWKKYVSLDKRNWTLHNKYLSLHDIDNILNKIRENIAKIRFERENK